MISTRRRLEYAAGYLELGLTELAGKELQAIPAEECATVDALKVRCDYEMARKEWKRLVTVARALANLAPLEEAGWISWAYALRELDRISEAQAVLLEAEPTHGSRCGVLHYNLACYACLLGNYTEAWRRLGVACRMSREWAQAALGDTDLQALWVEIPKRLKRGDLG